MKKILLIVFLLLGSVGYTQPVHNPPPCPDDPNCKHKKDGVPISSALPALLVLGTIYGFRKQK